MWSWSNTAISTTVIPDGLSSADIDQDGNIDVLACNGGNGEVFWYEQGGDLSTWTKHTIATGFSELEAVNAADVDGDGVVEVTIADQTAGELIIAKPDSGPTGSWSTTVLDSAAPSVRDHFPHDLTGDGDVDIIYSYEGTTSGEGGIYWLENAGGDPMSASNWTKHEMAQVDGALLACLTTRDLSGDGTANDVAGATRDHDNPAASREIFWLEAPTDPTTAWTKHTIDTNIYGAAGDFGNLFDNGHAKDLLLGGGDGDSGLFRWDYTNGWGRTKITSTTDTGWYSTQAVTVDGSVSRAEIAAGKDGDEDLVLLSWDGSQYTEQLREDPYGKTGPMPVHDLDGNGDNEIITGSNQQNRIDWWEISPP